MATEADAAQPFGKRKRKTVGITTSTETAQPLGRRRGRLLGTALEASVALAFGRVKSVVIGTASELDEALPITRPAVALIQYTPPTHEDQIRAEERILRYHRLTTANSIVRVNGVFQSIRTPRPELLEGLVHGEDYFRGGYLYEIPQSLATELINAGFPSG